MDECQTLFRFRSWLSSDNHDVYFYTDMIAALAQKIQTMERV